MRFRIKGPAKWLARAASVAGRTLTAPIAQGVKSAGDLVGKVPVIGTPLHSALSIAAGPFQLVDAVIHGQRIDRAVLNSVKNQISAVREIAPYAQLIVSSIPGIGQGVSAGLAMATAIANGQPLTAAAIAGVKGAIPGGAIGAAVFEFTQKAVAGDNILKAGVSVGLNQLPPQAQQGLDLVVRASKGENIPKLALEKARENLPPEYRQALDVGVAVGQGRKLQGAIAEGIKNVGKKELTNLAMRGSSIVSSNPIFAETAKLVKSGQETSGYNVGVAVMGYAGVNEESITQFRSKLSREAQTGFDLAVSARIGKVMSKPAPANLSPMAKAGFYTTKGLSGGGPKMNAAQMKRIAANKEARKGATIAIREMPKKGFWAKLMEFVGLG